MLSCLQKGIRVPLQVFKTEKKGWGLRSPVFIPVGTFVCEYVGEILTDSEAEHIGKTRGTMGRLAFRPIEKYFVCCDLSACATH